MRHSKKALKSAVCDPSETVIPLNFTPESEGTQQLYWRGNRWYASFRLPGDRVPHRVTTGTPDVGEARRKAQSEFIKLQARLTSGKPRREVTFRGVAEKLVKELESELEARKKYGERAPNGDRLRHHQTLGKKINHLQSYLIPYFGDKEIREITDKDVSEVKTFFATYWTEGPGRDITKFHVIKNGKPTEVTRRTLGQANRNTVNQYVMTLNEVFRYAKVHFATEHRLTKTAYADREISARASITMDQWAHIVATQEARIAAEKRGYHKIRLRRILWAFEWILHSGLRVAELGSLTWGNIKVIPFGAGRTLQLLNVTSKLKPVRTVTCRGEIMDAHDAMAEQRKTEDGQEFVFSNEFDPYKPCSLIDGVQKLLQEAGLWEDGKGGYRTLGSMRHTYAQQMIHNMLPFNLFKLAHNMGTSEKQIRDHYAADINMREDLEALAGTIDVGLANVFTDAAPAPKREPANPYLSDAREMVRMWEEVGDDWRAMDDQWIAAEIRNTHGEFTFSMGETAEFIATIRARSNR